MVKSVNKHDLNKHYFKEENTKTVSNCNKKFCKTNLLSNSKILIFTKISDQIKYIYIRSRVKE